VVYRLPHWIHHHTALHRPPAFLHANTNRWVLVPAGLAYFCQRFPPAQHARNFTPFPVGSRTPYHHTRTHHTFCLVGHWTERRTTCRVGLPVGRTRIQQTLYRWLTLPHVAATLHTHCYTYRHTPPHGLFTATNLYRLPRSHYLHPPHRTYTLMLSWTVLVTY